MIVGPLSAACAAAVLGLSLGHGTIRVARRNMLVAELGRSWLASAAAAAVTGSAAVALVSTCSTTQLLVDLPLVVFALPAVVVDAHEQRLPDALTSPLAIATAAVTLSASIVDPAAGLRAVAAAAAVTAAALLFKAIRSDVIGWGDVKLLPSLAAVLGWSSWAAVLDAVVLWGAFIAVQSMVSTTLARRSPVPYGPALLAGVVGALLAA